MPSAVRSRRVRNLSRSEVEYQLSYDLAQGAADHVLGNLGAILGPIGLHDTVPRVILVPGVGLFALGKSSKDARIAADVADNAVRTITDAEAIGTFESVSEADIFDVEYWSLEQAKLGKEAEKPLARQISLVTGGGSGIGAATAAAFAAQGAEVVVVDRDLGAADSVAKKLGGFAVACDVTKAADVRAAFDKACAKFGGVDILVSHAGAAWQGRIGEVDDKILRDSFELNFLASGGGAERGTGDEGAGDQAEQARLQQNCDALREEVRQLQAELRRLQKERAESAQWFATMMREAAARFPFAPPPA